VPDKRGEAEKNPWGMNKWMNEQAQFRTSDISTE